MRRSRHPESLMMSYGYKPELSEGSVKPPIFQTSTFTFKTAEEGKAFFEVAYGLREKNRTEEPGLIYSRINNPNLEILEDRLCLWDQAESCTVFNSGMSAISTVLLELVKPGDLLVYSRPTYGGTDHFINHFLTDMGVHSIGFYPDEDKQTIIDKINNSGYADRLTMIYIETPANPTNDLIDIAMCRDIADNYGSNERRVTIAVDNTYMGPIWSNPIKDGSDLVIYSATKYIGGHSDLIAGAVLGNKDLMSRVRTLRTFLGNMPSPHTCWLLLRSLETLKVRMHQQAINAEKVARFLKEHPLVKSVHYLGLLKPNSKYYKIYKRQYHTGGAMISFEIDGGEKEAFIFLNNLKLMKLAVSLGSTESLAEHPDTMTHAGMCPNEKQRMGIISNLVRLSIGIEHYEDLIQDVGNALDKVNQQDDFYDTKTVHLSRRKGRKAKAS